MYLHDLMKTKQQIATPSQMKDCKKIAPTPLKSYLTPSLLTIWQTAS